MSAAQAESKSGTSSAKEMPSANEQPTSTPAGTETKEKIPFRQIRALYDADTITVYQAYNAEIASEAVAKQRLDASPLYKPSRMTWIKPSWSWMMYRSGYSFKDTNQERILAIRMRHEHFLDLLRRGVLPSHKGPQHSSKGLEATEVRIQWDPERTVRLGKLEYRSIQIGVPGGLVSRWVGEWIDGIEDVTERARELERVLDAEPLVEEEELVRRSLVPLEREYVVPEELRGILKMDRGGH